MNTTSVTSEPIRVGLFNLAQTASTFGTLYDLKERIAAHIALLKGVRIGFFLEARTSEGFEELQNYCKSNGFQTQRFTNNDTELSMGIYLVTRADDSFELVETKCFWHAGENNKRFPDNAWGTIGVLATFKRANGSLFSVIATQFPHSVANKRMALQSCLKMVPDHETIILADANTFADTPEEEEFMEEVLNCGTPLLKEGTWLGWEKDYPIPNGTVGKQLDHAIAFNGLKASVQVETGEQLAESENNFRFSDHAALIVTLEE